MKKIILAIIIALALPTIAFAIPTNVDRITDRIEPLLKGDYIKATYFTASSTSIASTFPYASTTAISTANAYVTGTTTSIAASTTYFTNGLYTRKFSQLAESTYPVKFNQYNTLFSTTTFHVPRNYYLATSTLNLSAAIASNNSGVTYFPQNHSLMFVNNSNFIYEFSMEGRLLRTITMASFTDTEALGWMYDDWFVVGDEQGTGITWLRIPNGSTTINKNVGTTINTSSIIGTGNSTIEGVAYDIDRDVFYVGKEGTGTTMGMYQVTKAGAITSMFSTSTFQTNGIGDISDVYFDRNTQHLFLGVDQCYGEGNGGSSTLCDGVIEVTLEGQILDKLAAPSGFTQVEGVGFTPDGQYMFIEGEADMFAAYKYMPGDQTFAIFQNATTTPVNFGIGTTSPYSRLSVAGQGVFQNLIATSTTSTSTFAGAMAIGTTTTTNSAVLTIGTSTSPTATTTVYIDSALTKGACLVLKDSDGVGYTFIVALNGSLVTSTVDCR